MTDFLNIAKLGQIPDFPKTIIFYIKGGFDLFAINRNIIMNREPRSISNEEPHQKLDPKKMRARANEGYRGASQTDYEEYNDYEEYCRQDADEESGTSRVSAARRVIGKIILYIQAAVTVLLIFLLAELNILPMKLLILSSVILVILWFVIFTTQRRCMNKIQAVGMVLSIIFSAVMVFGSLYLNKTNEMLKTVTGRSYDINTYNVAVRTEDTAQTITDVRDYRFGIQSSFKTDDLTSVIEDIEEAVGGTIETVDLDSSIAQAEALLTEEVDAIIYNDAFTSTIVEQYELFEQQTRILQDFTVKAEAKVIEVEDVDISDGAFLAFISGNDSNGAVSLTGRSDVNIVAGINTVSQQILLITIPRDYYVEFPGITVGGSRDKLTHAGIYGMDKLLATVSQLFGYDINYYVRVNFSSMQEIVDALGGVTVYNEQEFTSIDGYYYPEGYVEMDGLYALNYVRERHAFEDGDFARGRNQLKVIQAMMDKLISVNTISNYYALADAVANFAATNIPSDMITDLIKLHLEENLQWHVVTYQVLGAVMLQPCQSANGAYLSVDMPYEESVQHAKTLLQQLYEGEVLSEDLQLEDNGQLTYVVKPVG